MQSCPRPASPLGQADRRARWISPQRQTFASVAGVENHSRWPLEHSGSLRTASSSSTTRMISEPLGAFARPPAGPPPLSAFDRRQEDLEAGSPTRFGWQRIAPPLAHDPDGGHPRPVPFLSLGRERTARRCGPAFPRPCRPGVAHGQHRVAAGARSCAGHRPPRRSHWPFNGQRTAVRPWHLWRSKKVHDGRRFRRGRPHCQSPDAPMTPPGSAHRPDGSILSKSPTITFSQHLGLQHLPPRRRATVGE